MLQEIQLTFHNQGLRSFIEVDLCIDCPRQDSKGCCGYYSPVFYASDFAFLLQHNRDLIEYILSLGNITILDASVTINREDDGQGFRCQFHTREKGCMLSQNLRESICRLFVCPGINWEQEPQLKHWKDFFDQLFEYEINLNNIIADSLSERNLSLRDSQRRGQFFSVLLELFKQETATPPAFFNTCRETEKYILKREIKYGVEWPL
ncbi:MAG: hypothetical protein ACOX0E_07260 [Syntrophomonadaceae bacterium]